jgi:hypothetical protein
MRIEAPLPQEGDLLPVGSGAVSLLDEKDADVAAGGIVDQVGEAG